MAASFVYDGEPGYYVEYELPRTVTGLRGPTIHWVGPYMSAREARESDGHAGRGGRVVHLTADTRAVLSGRL